MLYVDDVILGEIKRRIVENQRIINEAQAELGSRRRRVLEDRILYRQGKLNALLGIVSLIGAEGEVAQ